MNYNSTKVSVENQCINIDYFCGMSLHIGELIKKVVRTKNVKVEFLAKKLDMTQNNVFNIYKRESIGTSELLRLSEVLDYNFFVDLANQSMMVDAQTPEASLIMNETGDTYGKGVDKKAYHELALKYIQCLEENKQLRENLK